MQRLPFQPVSAANSRQVLHSVPPPDLSFGKEKNTTADLKEERMRAEWKPAFFFLSNEKLTHFGNKTEKKNPHHIELISRKPSHSRCIPLLSLEILPATASPARSDEE